MPFLLTTVTQRLYPGREQPLLPVTEQEDMASCYTMGGVDWVLGKISSPEGLSKHWSRLPRLLVESPSLQIFKIYVVCRDMVSWWTWQYWIKSWT